MSGDTRCLQTQHNAHTKMGPGHSKPPNEIHIYFKVWLLNIGFIVLKNTKNVNVTDITYKQS